MPIGVISGFFWGYIGDNGRMERTVMGYIGHRVLGFGADLALLFWERVGEPVKMLESSA